MDPILKSTRPPTEKHRELRSSHRNAFTEARQTLNSDVHKVAKINMSGVCIKVLLNNNPACETALQSTVKDEVWHMRNRPFVKVAGEGLVDGQTFIIVSYGLERLIEEQIKVIDGAFSVQAELLIRLPNACEIQVEIQGVTYKVAVRSYRLYGTVRYLSGVPVPYPVLECTDRDIVGIGNREGEFELLLSDREAQIGVFDSGYSKTTLEAWLYNVHLTEDKRLDIRIDKAEVYGITLWHQHGSDYIHFIPMSLTRVNHVVSLGFGGEQLDYHPDTWGRLTRKDVHVYVDGDCAELLAFSEVEDFLTVQTGRKPYRFGYVVSIPTVGSGSCVKIVVESRYVLGETVIVDKGEGYYFVS
jgi:hypothetical protein